MWKKSDPNVVPTTTVKTPAPPRTDANTARKARIGAGVSLKGELFGKEDIIIEGHVEGKITLEQHGVIVEESGRVDGDIVAASICVSGVVSGNLNATEQAVLLKTGRVEGNIYAKSVTLETGAQFKGSIDMEKVIAPSNVAQYTKASNDGAKKPNGSAHSVTS